MNNTAINDDQSTLGDEDRDDDFLMIPNSTSLNN
jgi:hypothetical protein